MIKEFSFLNEREIAMHDDLDQKSKLLMDINILLKDFQAAGTIRKQLIYTNMKYKNL